MNNEADPRALQLLSRTVSLPLEIGRTYLRGDGQKAKIEGHIKGSTTIVWSLQGDWYDQATGAFVVDAENTRVLSTGNWRSIAQGPLP